MIFYENYRLFFFISRKVFYVDLGKPTKNKESHIKNIYKYVRFYFNAHQTTEYKRGTFPNYNSALQLARAHEVPV